MKINNNKVKETSFSYGSDLQNRMLTYYWKSKIKSKRNTEYLRVVLANTMINKYALPRLKGKNQGKITVVDVGCSVGLFAIEYAKKGFDAYGLDFDPEAIKIAKKLNDQEKTKVKFFKMDVSDWNFDKPIDIAICFDIFEHLHDDELGSLLVGIRKKLSKNGCIVFHTLPMQYDYLFWNSMQGKIKFPFLLRFFKNISVNNFSKIVKIYALLIDVLVMLKRGKSHQEIIKKDGHCNPLTKERFEDIFLRAGYKPLYYNSGFLSDVQYDISDKKYFNKQLITHRSLMGVIVPSK